MKAFARYEHMLLLDESLDMPANMSTGGAVLGLVAGRQSKCTEQSVYSVTVLIVGACACRRCICRCRRRRSLQSSGLSRCRSWSILASPLTRAWSLRYVPLLSDRKLLC